LLSTECHCREKTAVEDQVNDQKAVIGRVITEVRHVESLMTDEMRHGMAKHEHTEPGMTYNVLIFNVAHASIVYYRSIAKAKYIPS